MVGGLRDQVNGVGQLLLRADIAPVRGMIYPIYPHPYLARFLIIGPWTIESHPQKRMALFFHFIVIWLLGFGVGHRSFGVMGDDLILDLGVGCRWNNLLA